jgi:hypothetical protein
MPSIISVLLQKVDGMPQNHWTVCIGIGGRHAPESMDDFPRIMHKGTLDVSLVENINQSIECRCNQLTPFKTILPKWDRGETFFGLINLGGNYTQYYIWQE